MPLTNLEFSLPENFSLENFSKLQKQTALLKELVKTAGTHTDAFKVRLKEIYQDGGGETTLLGLLKSPLDVRATVHLWVNNANFLQVQPVTQAILNRFREIRKKQSLMVIYGLLRLYFNYFDQLANQRYLEVFLNAELKNFENENNKKVAQDLYLLTQYRKLIFTSGGPLNVLMFCKQHNMELTDALLALGLRNSGRYADVCKFHYYIETIKQLTPGDNHPVMTEIIKQDVFNSPYKGELKFGHEIIRAIVQTVERHNVTHPGEIWLNCILNIAGDPRVPTANARYQQWWAILGEQIVLKVKRWLSEKDLRLFLEILEDYVERSGNQGLQRMFPARKVFLEGLIKLDLVKESRLFIGQHAENHLTSRYRNKQKDLPNYAQLSTGDSSKSVIYMAIQHGNKECIIVEGSHNFPMLIFDSLPMSSQIDNYSRISFEESELNSHMIYLRQYDSSCEKYSKIVHHPNLTWQNKALKIMEQMNIKIDPEAVLTSADYREYRRKFGILWFGM